MRHEPPIAAIDIGSNSIQLTLARVRDDRIETLERIKDPARLAGAIDRRGRLTTESIDRAVATLQKFGAVAREHGAVVRATATAAMRAARNADEVLARIREEAGIPVELISGHDEARLTYGGVLWGMPELRRRTILCVDVGGGSTELAVGHGPHVMLSASVPMGSLKVAKRLLGPDPVSRNRVSRARRMLRAALNPRIADVRGLGFERAIATSGTIQRVARIAIALEGGAVPIDVHGLSLTREVLADVVNRLAHAPTRAERLAIPGMDPDRADSLLGGALIFQVLTEGLHLDRWTVSMSALRTGLLVDTRQRARGAS